MGEQEIVAHNADHRHSWRLRLKAAIAAPMARTARIAVIIGTALLFQIGLFIGERLYPPTFNPPVLLIAVLLMASWVGAWGLVIVLGLWGGLWAPRRDRMTSADGGLK
jgi:hypothetical protein